MIRRLTCYVFGRGSRWQAICTDFNIAVQAPSSALAKSMLLEAIDMHVETAMTMDDKTRRQLLNRKAPFAVRLRLRMLAAMHSLRTVAPKGRNSDRHVSGFNATCHA